MSEDREDFVLDNTDGNATYAKVWCMHCKQEIGRIENYIRIATGSDKGELRRQMSLIVNAHIAKVHPELDPSKMKY